MEIPNENLISLWYHYEEIAMHFNSLIIQFRIQLIGGVGAIGAAATYLIGGRVEEAKQRAWLRTVMCWALFVLVLAGALLDLGYYDPLLRRAVDAIAQFEYAHREIRMSVHIREGIGYWQDHMMWFAYALMLVPLFIFGLWSWGDWKRMPKASSGEHVVNAPPAQAASISQK